MSKFLPYVAAILLTFAAGCYAQSSEAPYNYDNDYDPANMEHLLYQYNKATNEQKDIVSRNMDRLQKLNREKNWTSLFKSASGLLWAYPTPEALVHLGDAFLNTGVEGKDRRELIDRKKTNFSTALSYYSAALKFSRKVSRPIPKLADQTRVKIECIEEYIASEKFSDTGKCGSIVSVLADNKISI